MASLQIRPVSREPGAEPTAWRLIRWQYQGGGKSERVEVARVQRSLLADFGMPTPDVAAKLDAAGLTAAERSDVLAWWASTHEGIKARAASARVSAWRVADLAAAVAEAPPEVVAAQAPAIWAAVDALTTALRKAGHPRPKPGKGAPAAPEPTPLEQAISARAAGAVQAAGSKPPDDGLPPADWDNHAVWSQPAPEADRS